MSPARKIIAFAEQFGVRSAWHGPGDVSPVGHAAQITLDVTAPNFGVQEYSPFSERTQEVFQGCPVMKDGYWYVNEAPGWGIESGREGGGEVSLRIPAKMATANR